MLFTQLRYVNQAIDISIEADECTKAGNLGHSSLGYVSDLELRINIGPWICIELLDSQ